VIHYTASIMNRQTGKAGRNYFLVRLTCPLVLLCVAINTMAAEVSFDRGFVSFDDAPLEEPLSFPDWFKLSFLDLREDIEEVKEAGKQGLIVYFGQKYCAYCKQFLEADLEAGDIQTYLREHFDIIGIDIHGDRTVTDMQGRELTESALAIRDKTNFTPSVIFYNTAGKEVLRLRGYYPPYRFRAALEYVADAHYRDENYRQYLARADVPLVFEPGDLIEEPFFLPGPYMLDRTVRPGERPLVVFFEQGNCHACDVLHTGPLQDPEIVTRFEQMENVQLPFWSNTPVITPSGERLTARQWAENLGLFYTPTLIFFDENGREIMRVDSVVQFYRLRNVLDYILSGGYREYPTFQRWRTSRSPMLLK
jgi:thioredoxin-related protein